MNNTAIMTSKPLKQHLRRAIVLGCYLGGVLMAIGWTLEQPLRWFVVIPYGMVCILSMGLLLMPYVLGISEGTDEMLDERQRQARNQTYLNAYRILGLMVILTAGYFHVAVADGRWWLPKTEYELNIAFWGTLLIAITLPAALTAWLEPDPILED
jgi:hypothetical protein